MCPAWSTHHVEAARTGAAASAGSSIAPTPPRDEQEFVLDAVRAKRNVFLTGGAGTGKSYVIKRIQQLADAITAVTATTGPAAYVISGVTIHKWSGMGLHLERDPPRFMREGSWRTVERLVIDECSMLDGADLDRLEAVARDARKSDKPFGGIQLILCGDFAQLSPVNTPRDGKPKRETTYAFNAKCWDKLGFWKYELTKIRRQNESELKFIELLHAVRRGVLTDAGAALLQSRVNAKIRDAVQLAHRNRVVDRENQSQFNSIPGPALTCRALDVGKFGNEVPQFLELKIGAPVVLTRNLGGPLVNGALGKVVSLKPSSGSHSADVVECVVSFTGFGGRATIKAMEFESQSLAGVTRTQLPLRLAWAVTIHRSQGQTLSAATIHFDDLFDASLVYVALSRVPRLEQLAIRAAKPITAQKLKVEPPVEQFFKTFRSDAPIPAASSIDAPGAGSLFPGAAAGPKELLAGTRPPLRPELASTSLAWHAARALPELPYKKAGLPQEMSELLTAVNELPIEDDQDAEAKRADFWLRVRQHLNQFAHTLTAHDAKDISHIDVVDVSSPPSVIGAPVRPDIVPASLASAPAPAAASSESPALASASASNSTHIARAVGPGARGALASKNGYSAQTIAALDHFLSAFEKHGTAAGVREEGEEDVEVLIWNNPPDANGRIEPSTYWHQYKYKEHSNNLAPADPTAEGKRHIPELAKYMLDWYRRRYPPAEVKAPAKGKGNGNGKGKRSKAAAAAAAADFDADADVDMLPAAVASAANGVADTTSGDAASVVSVPSVHAGVGDAAADANGDSGVDNRVPNKHAPRGYGFLVRAHFVRTPVPWMGRNATDIDVRRVHLCLIQSALRMDEKSDLEDEVKRTLKLGDAAFDAKLLPLPGSRAALPRAAKLPDARKYAELMKWLKKAWQPRKDKRQDNTIFKKLLELDDAHAFIRSVRFEENIAVEVMVTRATASLYRVMLRTNPHITVFTAELVYAWLLKWMLLVAHKRIPPGAPVPADRMAATALHGPVLKGDVLKAEIDAAENRLSEYSAAQRSALHNNFTQFKLELNKHDNFKYNAYFAFTENVMKDMATLISSSSLRADLRARLIVGISSQLMRAYGYVNDAARKERHSKLQRLELLMHTQRYDEATHVVEKMRTASGRPRLPQPVAAQGLPPLRPVAASEGRTNASSGVVGAGAASAARAADAESDADAAEDPSYASYDADERAVTEPRRVRTEHEMVDDALGGGHGGVGGGGAAAAATMVDGASERAKGKKATKSRPVIASAAPAPAAEDIDADGDASVSEEQSAPDERGGPTEGGFDVNRSNDGAPGRVADIRSMSDDELRAKIESFPRGRLSGFMDELSVPYNAELTQRQKPERDGRLSGRAVRQPERFTIDYSKAETSTRTRRAHKPPGAAAAAAAASHDSGADGGSDSDDSIPLAVKHAATNAAARGRGSTLSDAGRDEADSDDDSAGKPRSGRKRKSARKIDGERDPKQRRKS